MGSSVVVASVVVASVVVASVVVALVHGGLREPRACRTAQLEGLEQPSRRPVGVAPPLTAPPLGGRGGGGRGAHRSHLDATTGQRDR